MAKVLWLGDGGCTTGFGKVTHEIGERLQQMYGHDIHVLAVNYKGDYFPTTLKLYLPTLKVQHDVYGQSRFVEMIADIDPDIVIMLNDPYVVLKFLFRNNWDTDLITARARPMLAYMPVDGHGFPTNWTRLPELVNGLRPLLDNTGPKFQPVVMSKHGWQMFPDAPLVYHGVNTDEFYPATQDHPIVMSNGFAVTSKTDAKRAFGMDPDGFLVLRVDRNSHRKNYADTWRALQPLMHKYSDIKAWFHCRAEGDMVELPQLVSRDPAIADRFHWPGDFNTHRGWATSDLAALYNAADIFVSTSWGEGFGLTLAEAISSGLPVIAQNVSAIPEVVGPGGILLEPERSITVDSGEDQWLPDVAAFTEAIERLYLSRGARRTLSEAGRLHAYTFRWDEAARRFDELITTTLAGVVPATDGDAPWRTDAEQPVGTSV